MKNFAKIVRTKNYTVCYFFLMHLNKIIKDQYFNRILFKLIFIQKINKQQNQLVFDIFFSFTVNREKSAADKEPSNSLHSMIYRQRLDKSAKSNTHL